uniref:SEFIR domain-containing protein n=1 Tax=Globodera pallida TaxID=36090 RepID=A0A183CCW2_GLOPA
MPILLLLSFAISSHFLLPQPSSTATLMKDPQSQKRSRYSFTENCADAHDKDYISCVASSVDCNIDLEKLFPSPTESSKSVYPSEAHDVRIETFAKAMPTRANGDGQTHQLLVDISLQTPPNNSTHLLKAFLLEIEGESGRKHACFLLNVSGTEWTPEKVAQSPRLHFASNSLFSFSQSYEVELYSLPEKSAGTGASVHTRLMTPHNPSGNSTVSADFVSANCSKRSNQFASKWTAGFRHIYVHSAARVMQVEFVGAPPQYCFESYEVRLLDETGLELLFSGTVLVEEMQRNGKMLIGQYNFTDLEYDRMYIPSVIPVERAADSRCLCPVFGIDPYDVKVVCSCVAADWRPVRMTRPDVVKLCPGCIANQSFGLLPPTMDSNAPSHNKMSIMWPLFVLFNTFFLLLLCIFIVGYMHFHSSESIPRKIQFQAVRFVPPSRKGDAEQQKDSGGLHIPRFSSSVASSLAVRTNLGLGTVSTASLTAETPLISADDKFEAAMSDIRLQNVLIVYSHDGEEHERAVIALAEFLRAVFNLNISLDRWDLKKIERNLIDWLSASVVGADKVLVINSAGTWERYHAKALCGGTHVVEKIESDYLDGIFIAQIDMALQHHSLVSVRFNYTKPEQTLPMLNGRLQYILPDNICPLVSAIFGQNMRQDERLAPTALSSCANMSKLCESIDKMADLCVREPNWLVKTHQRRRIVRRNSRENHSTKQKMTEFNGPNRSTNVSTPDVTATKFADERTADMVELVPFSIMGQQQNGGKMDSGIFEWNGSDGDSGGMTSVDRDDIEALNTDKTISECAKGNEATTEARTINVPIFTEKTAVEFVERVDKNDGMDSGLIADSSQAAEKKEEIFQEVAAI